MDTSNAVSPKPIEESGLRSLSFGEFHKKVNEAGYVADQKLSANVYATIFNRPVAGAFLFGYSGSGKTFLPEVMSQVANMKQVFYQCFPNTREEDLMTKLLPSEETPSGIKIADGPLVEAIEASKKEPVLLLIDEWDKTRSSSDSFLLNFLQSGTVHYNGEVHKANTENLYVYITMNDERDLSEPLQRRMPKIEFDMLEPKIVAKALSMTHSNHPLLGACIKLYQFAYSTVLNKPVTIQEMRQLMDASDALGEMADWDSLVYQYVTKDESNHMAISDATKVELPDIEEHTNKEERGRLDAEVFGKAKYDIDFAKNAYGDKAIIPSLPKKSIVKIKMGSSKEVDVEARKHPEASAQESYGVIPFTEASYSRLQEIYCESDNSGVIKDHNGEDFAVVKEDFIYIVRRLNFFDVAMFTKLLHHIEHQGEIAVQARMKRSEALGIFTGLEELGVSGATCNPYIVRRDTGITVIEYKSRSQSKESFIDIYIGTTDDDSSVADVEIVGKSDWVRSLVLTLAQIGFQAVGFRFSAYDDKMVDIANTLEYMGEDKGCYPEDMANICTLYSPHHIGAVHRDVPPKMPLAIFVTPPADRNVYYNIRRSKHIAFSQHEGYKETYVSKNGSIVYAGTDNNCIMALYGKPESYMSKKITEICGEKTLAKAVLNHTKEIWYCYASVSLSKQVVSASESGFYTKFNQVLVASFNKASSGNKTSCKMTVETDQTKNASQIMFSDSDGNNVGSLHFRQCDLSAYANNKYESVLKGTKYQYSVEYMLKFDSDIGDSMLMDVLELAGKVNDNIVGGSYA